MAPIMFLLGDKITGEWNTSPNNFLNMALPIKFSEFAKDPVKGLLFLVIVAIGYLYVDIRSTYSGGIEQCDEDREKLEIKVDRLVDHVRKSDSALAYSISKIEMLTIMMNDEE